MKNAGLIRILIVFAIASCSGDDGSAGTTTGETSAGTDPTASGTTATATGSTSAPTTGSTMTASVTTDATETAGSTDATETAGSTGADKPSLESCMAITGIDLKCDDTSHFQYISFGDVLGCGGSASFSTAERVRFTYSIEEIVDDVIQVRSIRVVADGGGSTLLESFAASPTPLPAFPQSLESPESDLLSDPPGLFEVHGAAGVVELDAVPTKEELDANAVVSGVFELNGGDVSNLGQAVEDPGIRVFGCFFGPSEAHAIELD